MDRKTATEEIKARWKELYPADGRRGKGNGIICPLCGSGSGNRKRSGAPPTYSGIKENKHSKNLHALHCFACKFSGSVIDLYMKETSLQDFRRAVDDLAARLGITIDPYKPAAAEEIKAMQGSEKKSSLIGEPGADQQAADYREYYRQCMRNLMESAAAQAYLQRRGISLETAIRNGVGFDPAADPANAPGATGNEYKPHPCPRIILPTTAAHYVGRSIDPTTDAAYQKMNPNENKGAGKPGIFGMKKAFSSGAEVIFVTEGAFDALSILEVGAAAVALNSASNAGKLIEALEQTPTKATLILCLDNDRAGRAAAEELRAGLQRLNISNTTANIAGAHKDPNEALTADRAAFEQAIKNAIRDTAARPDNTAAYLEKLMAGEIELFREAQNRMTGYANLDEKAGGLNAGLYVLAAISSLGKTTFALQMADQMAAAGQEVLFFSMEQSRLEMVSKSLARLTAQADLKTAVNSLSIRRGNQTEQVKNAAQRYKDQTGDRLSIIEGNFNCDIGYIADYIRRYRQRTGAAPIVFIDYLQILQPSREGKSSGSKREEIDLAITELKRLSREENLTIIVISSINRANYMTPFAFESLKESGQIEFTADVVWGLQLACLDEAIFDKEGNIKTKRDIINRAKAEEPRKIKFVCLKNRYGISSFDCSFSYYPQFDLFIPDQSAPTQQKQPARKVTASGKFL